VLIPLQALAAKRQSRLLTAMRHLRHAMARFLRPLGQVLLAWVLILSAGGAYAITASTTTLSLPPASTTIGTAILLTATIDGANPSGMVTFKDGAATLGSAVLRGSTASLNASFATAGAHTLTAVYDGDAQNSASTSAAASLTVNKAATTTTLAVPATTLTVNQTVTLTASVSGASPGGSVSFQDGATVIGSAPLNAGKASLSISFQQAGSHSLTAVYAGDSNYEASTSAARTVIVNSPPVSKTSTTTTLVASPNPAVAGQSTLLTATVSGGTPTGTVTFSDGRTTLGTASISAGQASFSTSFSASGMHGLSVAYVGDSNHAGSTATANLQVETASSTASVTLTSPANNSSYTAPATITLAANASVGEGAVAKVEFFSGGTLIGTATGAPYTINWTNVGAGTYSLTAKVTGTTGVTATSVPATILVNAVNTPPTVSITAPTTNASSAAPATITVSANAADSDGTVAKVEFFNGDALIGTAATAPYSTTWNNVSPGSYTITAKATDNQGGTAVSGAVTVNVVAAPVVNITVPATNTSFAAPAAILLQAAASASDPGNGSANSISQVAYYHDGEFIGSASQAPYTLLWDQVQAGSYSVSAVATDSLGGSASSSPVLVTVVENDAPTVSLTANPANAIAPAEIILTATAADGDGSVAQVAFYQGATLLGTATQAPYIYHWSGVAAGSYSLTAQVTDNLGATTISTPVTVTISGKPVQAYFIHVDHLDTPRSITDGNNQMVWQWDSDPFGVVPANQAPGGGNTFTFNLRFPGQYFDKETNLHYNYFRDYDPSTGRYIQSDSIGLKGGPNTYAYANLNPLTFIDPSGESALVAGVCVVVATSTYFVYKYNKFVKCVEKCSQCPNNPMGDPNIICKPPQNDGNTNPQTACRTYCTLDAFGGPRGKGNAGSSDYP
jgi:RHS repeat-associated protein